VSYTDDEKQAAVLRIVQGSPTFSRGLLGSRDVNATFGEVRELTNTSMYYEPDTIYYLLWLSKNYYSRFVTTTLTLIDELLDATDDLLKPNQPIDDVAAVDDARRALLDVEGALSRQGSVGGPAYARFNVAIARAREQLGRPVKLNHVPRGSSQSTTEIVRPRDEARSDIVTGFASLKAAHANLLGGVEYVLSAVEAYVSSGLATAVAANQVTRARADLEDLSSTLVPMTPRERVQEARGGLMRVLASQSALKSLATQPQPGEAKLDSGSTYRLTAYGTGTAPQVTGVVSAPWPLEGGATDQLEVDVGGALLAVDLIPGAGYSPGIEAAEVVGAKPDPFPIGPEATELGSIDPYDMLTKTIGTGGTYATTDKRIYLIVDGTRYEVPSSTTVFGSDLNATDLATQIAVVVPSSVLTVSAVINSSGLDWVVMEYNVAAPPTAPIRYSDRYIRASTGADSVDSGGATDVWPARVDQPGGAAAADVSRGWDDNRELLVQANDQTSATTVDLTPGSWPDYERTVEQVAADVDTDGVAEFEGDVQDGKLVVRSLDKGDGSVITIRSGAAGTPSRLGMQALGLAQEQEDRRSDVQGRTVVNLLNEDLSFRVVATASLVRETLLKARAAIVTDVSELSIAMPDETSDPSVGWTLSEAKLAIHSGDNRGYYGVTGTAWVGDVLELTLDRQLRDQTASNRHVITLESELLRITSNDSSPSSYVDVAVATSESADVVLGLPLARAIGAVERVLVERNDAVLGWVPADLRLNRIRVGDKIVDSTGDVATVAGVDSVQAGVIDVEPVSSDLSLAAFTVESTAARAYAVFETALQSWQDDLSPFDDDVLGWIDKTLAPILILDEPSRDQVDAAYSRIETYKTKIESLQTVLGSYSVSRIPVVDTSLRTMLEHGHDRARELLLQARIGDYFTATAGTSSYSGALMAAASDVTVQDINEPTMLREEGEAEFDRYMGGWVDAEDPALDFENEDELPDTPMSDYWPDDEVIL